VDTGPSVGPWSREAKGGQQNSGSIVNISSDAGTRLGLIGQINNYAAAKSGPSRDDNDRRKRMVEVRRPHEFGLFSGWSKPQWTGSDPGRQISRWHFWRRSRWAVGAQPEEAVKPVCFLLSGRRFVYYRPTHCG